MMGDMKLVVAISFAAGMILLAIAADGFSRAIGKNAGENFRVACEKRGGMAIRLDSGDRMCIAKDALR